MLCFEFCHGTQPISPSLASCLERFPTLASVGQWYSFQSDRVFHCVPALWFIQILCECFQKQCQSFIIIYRLAGTEVPSPIQHTEIKSLGQRTCKGKIAMWPEPFKKTAYQSVLPLSTVWVTHSSDAIYLAVFDVILTNCCNL